MMPSPRFAAGQQFFAQNSLVYFFPLGRLNAAKASGKIGTRRDRTVRLFYGQHHHRYVEDDDSVSSFCRQTSTSLWMYARAMAASSRIRHDRHDIIRTLRSDRLADANRGADDPSTVTSCGALLVAVT
jgi:hypothetical protein